MSEQVPPSRGPGRATPQSPGAASLVDSAQQIWLAGVGALGRAQKEGTRLFETLAREGADLERKARSTAGESISQVRASLDQQVDQARERAGDAWDRVEAVVEPRVARAVKKLGLPTRAEVDALRAEVETLRAELRARGARAAKPATPRKAAASKRAVSGAVSPGSTARKQVR